MYLHLTKRNDLGKPATTSRGAGRCSLSNVEEKGMPASVLDDTTNVPSRAPKKLDGIIINEL